MNTAILSTASVTWAMKAREALLSVGIASRLRRLRPGESRNGCAWGIELEYTALAAAAEALRRAGIPFRAD